MVGTGSQRGSDGKVDAAAARWFARMRSEERTPADERRFRSWLEAAPEHETAYAALLRRFDMVGIYAGAPEIRAMRTSALGRPQPAWRLTSVPNRAAAIAASLILAFFLVMSGLSFIDGRDRGVHETVDGVRTNAILDDGTLATLAAGSRIVPMFTPRERRVRLERGQAIFDVMPDPDRPFVVEVGEGEVVALGTEFDVRKLTDGFLVTLVKGKVEVSGPSADGRDRKSVKLNVGQQLSCGKDRLEVREVDLTRAISWRNGLLMAEQEPFVDFVDEFNRHSRYKLLIDRENPLNRKLRIDGTFRIDDPMRVVELLDGPEFEGHKLKVWHTRDASGNVRLRLYRRRSGD